MSKYRLTQRNIDSIPDFQIQVVEFDTTEEIESIDFVKQWVTNPEFIRFSLFQGALLVELNSKNISIAFLKNLEGRPTDLADLNLPVWKPPAPSLPVR